MNAKPKTLAQALASGTSHQPGAQLRVSNGIPLNRGQAIRLGLSAQYRGRKSGDRVFLNPDGSVNRIVHPDGSVDYMAVNVRKPPAAP